jgi:succinylglutamic semialdehyde dehydrogenase
MSKGHFINNQWVSGAGSMFTSINPATGEILWLGQEATPHEITAAFEGAQKALTGWSGLAHEVRVSCLQRFARQVETNKQKLTHQISLETGKPLWEAATEVLSVIGKIDLSIKAYETRCPKTETTSGDTTHILRYKPHGVIAVLGPFNFPAHLSNGHIVPALLAGNTIVYKPSELTPSVAEFIMQCWHDAQLPRGVIQCVQGGVATAKTLLSLDVQGVFFTGSYSTGILINKQFSERPEVILALEMGGNNPLVIDEVKDISGAVYHTILSTMLTAGQRCTCARRLILPNNSFGDDFLHQYVQACKRLTIASFEQTPEPFMGPVIRYEHAQAHLAKQQALIDSGGKALLSMSLLKPNTGFLSPGIIDMTNVNTYLDEEIFAPLVQVHKYNGFEEALTLANQTRYGLSAALFSDNVMHYNQFYSTIRAGLINWNKPTTGAASHLPFGGVGRSGNHRPSAYFATDYCAYPIASMEQSGLNRPENPLPGIF